MDSYTIARNKGGKPLHCGNGCGNYSIVEYHGFCELCWLKLTAHNRAVLRGENPPDPPKPPEIHVVKERVTVQDIPPEPRAVWRITGHLWRIGVTAAVAWLVWRVK